MQQPHTEHRVELNLLKTKPQTIHYQLTKSSRKTISIMVKPNLQVIVKAPTRMSKQSIEEFITKRTNWILKHLDNFSRHAPPQTHTLYQDGACHTYLGVPHTLVIKPLSSLNRMPEIITAAKLVSNKMFEKKRTASIKLVDQTLEVYTNKQDPHAIKLLLDKWFKVQAIHVLTSTFDAAWNTFNIYHYKKPTLKFRTMKTRWGSYSSKHNVTLNTELVKTALECIEYVIIHEFCHIQHLNHSQKFYALLEQHMPDWRTRKQKLKLAQYL